MDQRLLQACVDDVIPVRRSLHETPETEFELPKTRELVRKKLSGYGLQPIDLGGGIVSVVDGRLGDGPSIGLRADMDALPIREEACDGKEIVSKVNGKMHGCGHDGHTAVLLGVAKYLAATRDFRGHVILIFQAAEEVAKGAAAMIDAGLFAKHPCEAVYSFHNWPGKAEDIGLVQVREGPMLAAVAFFHVTVTGLGGHAGITPSVLQTPLDAAMDVAREFRKISFARQYGVEQPQANCVVRLSVFQTKESKETVISDTVELAGTVRGFSRETLAAVEQDMENACSKLRHDENNSTCKINLRFDVLVAPTVNSAGGTRIVQEAARASGLKVQDFPPITGGEDFGRMIEAVGGDSAIFAVCNGSEIGLHNPTYGFNEEIIGPTISVFMHIVWKCLR